MGYDVFDPQLQRYRAHKGEKPGVGTTVTRQFDTPLLFHPGTQWAYGGGHDFAGLMVERATRLRLQDYMARHVWSPLGIRDMTFRPHERGDLRPRMPKMSVRDTESGKAVWMDDGKGIWGFGNAEDDFGGSECCASPQEYFFILKALLRGGGELLKTESVEELFRPALSEDSRRSLEERFSVKEINLALGGLPMGTRKDYSIAGLLNMEDLAGMRSKGTLAWGGMPNLSWVSLLWSFFSLKKK